MAAQLPTDVPLVSRVTLLSFQKAWAGALGSCLPMSLYPHRPLQGPRPRCLLGTVCALVRRACPCPAPSRAVGPAVRDRAVQKWPGLPLCSRVGTW